MRRGIYLALVVMVIASLAWGQSIKTDGDIETNAQLVSSIVTGKPPLEVSSTTMVSNLNADQVDGMEASAFAASADTYTKAEVDALIAAASSQKRFYLGPTVDGDGPITACATGFHFASLFEIWDPSNLRYDVTVPGAVGGADIGQGPPAQGGWIRTGGGSSGSFNCLAWTSDSNIDSGSLAGLQFPNGSGTVWYVGTRECGDEGYLPVWCVED